MLLPFWISIIIETSLKLLLLDESKMNSVWCKIEHSWLSSVVLPSHEHTFTTLKHLLVYSPLWKVLFQQF
jgi:hypothetical protein